MKSINKIFLSALTVAIACIASKASSDLQDTIELVAIDSTWWFNDANVELEEAWISPDYDHSSWSRGKALLGYDTSGRNHKFWPDPGLQTALSENLITYYFRKEFEYAGSIDNMVMFIEQIIDDGAVYYLNGVEIGRSSLMPRGKISHFTTTSSTTNPQDQQEVIEVTNPPLHEGRNVLAVSVHNFSESSSDICFGARFSITHVRENPLALYLTWQGDPTSTMTIQWHTEGDTGDAYLLYSSYDDENDNYNRAEADTHPMVYSDRLIHTVELTDLKPDTTYTFRVANVKRGISSPAYKFRTMPIKANRPIRIVAGGDLMVPRELFYATNKIAVKQDPDFIVWGGDLAYADGRSDRSHRWYKFFEVMMESLITPSGRIIPIIAGIGNHEIRDHYYWGNNRGRDGYQDTNEFRDSIAPYYYNLFAFPGHPGYGILDFGDYLSILMLDSDHSGPIEGKQTEWLKEQLKERLHVPHVFPVYHVPGFPSFRPYNYGSSYRVRKHWVPLFEEFGVELSFEHHDHTYKRTFPILGESISDNGIIYMGDGAWGVPLRPVDKSRWYLNKSKSVLNMILITLHQHYRDIRVFDGDGNVIDHFFEKAGERADLR